MRKKKKCTVCDGTGKVQNVPVAFSNGEFYEDYEDYEEQCPICPSGRESLKEDNVNWIYPMRYGRCSRRNWARSNTNEAFKTLNHTGENKRTDIT